LLNRFVVVIVQSHTLKASSIQRISWLLEERRNHRRKTLLRCCRLHETAWAIL